jgi:hypothetical protein
MINEIVGILLRLSSANTQDRVRLDGVPEAAQAVLAAGPIVVPDFDVTVNPVISIRHARLFLCCCELHAMVPSSAYCCRISGGMP